MCLITTLILVLTIYNVKLTLGAISLGPGKHKNTTLGDAYDAFDKNFGHKWDSNLETINTKPATQRVPLFVTYAMGFVKQQLCIILAAASMMSLGGSLVFENRRPPEVPETLRS